MNSKKLITRSLLLVLSLVTVFSLAGCKEDKTTDFTEKTLYTKQYVNSRFYLQQGVPDNWEYSEGLDGMLKVDFKNEDGVITHVDGQTMKGSVADCGLVVTLNPSGVNNVKYNIYSIKADFMKATLGDFLIGLLGKNSYDFEFNNLFVDNVDRTARDAFVWTDDISDTQESLAGAVVEYNEHNFLRASYTFTVDGVDWKGMMLVTLGANGVPFHVITLETETSVWDANFAEMENMLKDFRLLGWEKEKD